jgi:hypothetical protein
MNRYKINYFNKSRGGAVQLQDDIFHIYTTGIANWGDFDSYDQNLVNLWNERLRDLIISKIPSKFNIKLYHFDPIFTIKEGYGAVLLEEGVQRNSIKEYINNNLIPYDYGNNRVISSEFNDMPLNLNIPNPHLIIDLGHVFRYPNKDSNNVKLVESLVNIAGNYNENAGELLNLKALRTGFLGNAFGSLFSYADTFRVSEEGTVKTFVDKLIELDYDYNINEPADFIEKIFKDIDIMLINKLKEIKGNAPLWKIEHIYQAIKPDNIDLLNSIMARFWNDIPIDEIINQVAHYIIQTHIDTISNMNPLD